MPDEKMDVYGGCIPDDPPSDLERYTAETERLTALIRILEVATGAQNVDIVRLVHDGINEILNRAEQGQGNGQG